MVQNAALNMPVNLENSTMSTGLKKDSLHSNLKKGQCQRMFKLHTTALISPANKVMLKSLQLRLQQYVKRELSEVLAGF